MLALTSVIPESGLWGRGCQRARPDGLQDWQYLGMERSQCSALQISSVPHYRLTKQRACPQRGLGARLHPSKCRPGPCRDRILTRVGEIYSLLDIHNYSRCYYSLIIIQITEQPMVD